MPATLGFVFGIWWSGWLVNFDADLVFEDIGIGRLAFRLIFVSFFTIGIPLTMRKKIEEWFPRR